MTGTDPLSEHPLLVATRRSPLGCALVVLLAMLLPFPHTAPAATLQELLGIPDLTPKKFARQFRDFRYVFMEEIQAPETFLRSKAGDCDDYAVVADLVLSQKGYHTRLVHVRMAGLLAHAVCYVQGEKLYLDFNNRGYFVTTERASPSLRDIASRVASSFGANWTSASEFTYKDGLKELVQTVVKTDAESAEKKARPPDRSLKVDF